MPERPCGIPAEAVERACVAYVEARFDVHHDIKPTDSERVGMRAALEASGAVFLSDDEREEALEAVNFASRYDSLGWSGPSSALDSAREKLSS